MKFAAIAATIGAVSAYKYEKMKIDLYYEA